MPDTAPAISLDREPPVRTEQPWSVLRRSKLNPRQHFNDEGLATLAESIAANGIFQNLTVRPHPDIEGEYEIVSGESRHRAVEILIKSGRATESYAMPVVIHDIDDTTALEIAMAENMARRDLTPMEEARGLAELKKRGVSTAQMAEKLGCTQRHVQLRLKLVEGLTAEAQEALEAGKINVETARVLATAPIDKQQNLLKDVQKHPWQYRNSDALRRKVNEILIPEKAAKFDIALYTGGWTEPDTRDIEAQWKADWDADEALRKDWDGDYKAYIDSCRDNDEDDLEIAGQRCFADVGQFMKLQKNAARAIADDLCKKGAAWAEIKTGSFFRSYDYETKKGNKAAGAIIFIDNHGTMTVHRDLVKRAQRSFNGGGAQEDAPAKPKGPQVDQEFPRVIFEEAAIAKYRLLQRSVAADPYIGLRILCADLLLSGQGTLALDPQAPNSGIDKEVVAALDVHLKRMPTISKGLKVDQDGISGPANGDLARLNALFGVPDDKILKLAGLLIASLIGGQQWDLGRKNDAPDIIAIAEQLKLKGEEVRHGLALTMEQIEDVGETGIRGIARDLKIEGWLLSTKATLLEKIRECIKRGGAKGYVLPPYRFGEDAEKQLAAIIKDTDAPAPAKGKTVTVGDQEVPRKDLAAFYTGKAAKKPAPKKKAAAKAKPKAKAKRAAKQKGGK